MRVPSFVLVPPTCRRRRRHRYPGLPRCDHRSIISAMRDLQSSPRRPAGGFLRALAAGALLLGALPLARLGAGPPEGREERPIGPGVRLLRWTRADGPNALYAV